MVSEDLICQKYTTIPLQFLHRNGIIHCRLWMSLMIPFMPNLLFSPPGDSVRLNCSVFCGKKPLKCKANWKINGRPLSPGQGYRQTHQKWAYSVLNLLSKISKSGVYSPQHVPFIQAHQMECVMQRIIRIWERPEKANMLPDLPNLHTSAPNCVSSFTTTVPGPLYSPYASSGQRHICCIFLSAHDQPSRRPTFLPSQSWPPFCFSLPVTPKRTRGTASPRPCSPSTGRLPTTYALSSHASERVLTTSKIELWLWNKGVSAG